MQTQNNQIPCLHNITKVGVNLIKPYDCWTFIVLFVSFWRKNQYFVLWGLSVRSITYVYCFPHLLMPYLHSCILISSPKTSDVASALLWYYKKICRLRKEWCKVNRVIFCFTMNGWKLNAPPPFFGGGGGMEKG